MADCHCDRSRAGGHCLAIAASQSESFRRQFNRGNLHAGHRSQPAVDPDFGRGQATRWREWHHLLREPERHRASGKRLSEQGLRCVAIRRTRCRNTLKNQEAFIRDEIQIVVPRLLWYGHRQTGRALPIRHDLAKNIRATIRRPAGPSATACRRVSAVPSSDVAKQFGFIEEKTDEQEQRVAGISAADGALRRDADCRRRTLLAYFSESFADENCGGCDNCLDQETFDGTVVAQIPRLPLSHSRAERLWLRAEPRRRGAHRSQHRGHP